SDASARSCLGSLDDRAMAKRPQPLQRNCDSVACQSFTRRLLPARRPVSGACPDIRPSNRLCATRISTVSVFPASTFLPTPNPIEPPWYGPVCPVVWKGWRREVSPYPDHRRILPVPARSSGGRLTERTPVVQSRRRERVKVPHSSHGEWQRRSVNSFF